MDLEKSFLLVIVLAVGAIIFALLYSVYAKSECMKVMKDKPAAEIQVLCRF